MKPLKGCLRVALFLSLLLAALPAVVAGAASGEIVLTVDATEASRHILHATESIPVHPGPLTLLYPKWIPGEHGPTGPVADFASLVVMVEGTPLPWRRDPEDMYAVYLLVPTGAGQIELTFDFLLAPRGEGFTSGASASTRLASVSWNQVILYPEGAPCDSISVLPRLILPGGWKYATALDTESQSGDTVRFSTVSLTTLVDSPVITGRHFRLIDISPATGVRHTINMVADGEAALDMPSWQIEAYKRLVLEANALFGARHYEHYDFLVTLSGEVAHFGLEHHQSSDNRMPERTFIDNSLQRLWAMLLPHEYAHSWNGKYRRPAGLSPSDYQKPLTGELLWVYEGLTTYLGELLAVRCGISTPEDFREHLALISARLDNLPGRNWRSLQDVADAAQVLYSARSDWQSVRRSVDFYDESHLIWLEADALIRNSTGGKKSLDDFCRNFLGGEDSAPDLRPFTYDDIVAALNDVLPYDWNVFWSSRLTSMDAHAPLGGVEQSGWKLAYRESPGGFQEAVEDDDCRIDSRFSLGVYFDEEGSMIDVIPGFPGALAGLAPGMKLVAVDGRKFTKDTYRHAMSRGKGATDPMEFLTSNGEFFDTYRVNYHGGERYPHLERDTAKPDLLSKIMQPIATKRASDKR